MECHSSRRRVPILPCAVGLIGGLAIGILAAADQVFLATVIEIILGLLVHDRFAKWGGRAVRTAAGGEEKPEATEAAQAPPDTEVK